MKKLILLVILSINTIASLNSIRLDYVSNKSGVIDNTKQKKVLIFLSASCPCSQKQFDHINELKKKNPKIKFIGFNSNKKISSSEAIEYFKNFKIDFPIYDDKDLSFANQFNALKTPHVFILDESNTVIYQGGVTNKRDPSISKKFYLRDNLQALNTSKELPYKKSKALGCYIAR